MGKGAGGCLVIPLDGERAQIGDEGVGLRRSDSAFAPPPQTYLSIVAPADNSTVTSPVSVAVNATNVSDPSPVMVLLNGADITSEMSKAGDTWSGTVQPPQINYGKNQIIINNTVDRSNDASKNSQFMISLADQEIAASNLAQYAINQYTDSLVTLGNDFNRVLSDWGRLRTVAGPIVSGQLQ